MQIMESTCNIILLLGPPVYMYLKVGTRGTVFADLYRFLIVKLATLARGAFEAPQASQLLKPEEQAATAC